MERSPMLREVMATARKEFRGFFASPLAYIFLGAFLVATLFLFFWLEAFFARNIADMQPMFRWMPILMIFLAAALTMRSWAEERRAGTLETLMTAPVRPLSLVLGKFLAAQALVLLALVLTLPLAISVSFMGSLDWGPVIGGYAATLCLAAAYLAIGLFVSAQTDNAVVSLIVTVVLASLFYLIGSDMLMALVGRDFAALLAAIGSGARFDSIVRGVLDLRDIYYYLSLTGVFLALNVLQLHRLRWAGNSGGAAHKATIAVALLAVANLLIANFWLAPVSEARADLTASGRYSLSDATHTTLAGLEEPLLIRGYFSSQTHPALAPLVPQLRDLLAEYAVAGGDRVRVEFVNPTEDPKAEEAAALAGIQPTPFQTSDRYSSAIVSSYFDIHVSYGDESATLGFRDLIEIKNRSGEQFEVGLANPEYALTSTIRKLTRAYRAGGDPFSAVPGGMTFRGYISAEERLPEGLLPVREALVAALEELEAEAGSSFSYSLEDPQAEDGALERRLKEELGLRPQIASLLDPQPFWFSLRLEGDGRSIPVTLPESGELDAAAFREAIEMAAKRLAPGFLRTVALSQPSPGRMMGNPMMPQMGSSYTYLRQKLGETARIIDVDLSKGQVPEGSDVLMVLAPSELDEKARFAIDQFLMRGGTVVVATSPYRAEMMGSLFATEESSGLEDWLAGLGVEIEKTMVLDPQNAALPVPSERRIAGIAVRELRMMPYPHFPDVRAEGLSREHPVTASLEQLTLNWASPIHLDREKLGEVEAHELVRSSPDSWTSDSLTLLPDYKTYPDSGFEPGEERAAQLLAVALTGRFTSAFAGEESPLLAQPEEAAGDAEDEAEDGAAEGEEPTEEAEHRLAGVIERSPENAKLVVVASATFGSDLMLDLASQGMGTLYRRPLDFLQNVVDWATEDPALLALRGETQFANMLRPMTPDRQSFWEYANYAFAVFGLGLVWGWRQLVRLHDRNRYARILREASA